MDMGHSVLAVNVGYGIDRQCLLDIKHHTQSDVTKQVFFERFFAKIFFQCSFVRKESICSGWRLCSCELLPFSSRLSFSVNSFGFFFLIQCETVPLPDIHNNSLFPSKLHFYFYFLSSECNQLCL